MKRNTFRIFQLTEAYFIISLFTLLVSCTGSNQVQEETVKSDLQAFEAIEKKYISDLKQSIIYFELITQATDVEVFRENLSLARRHFKYAEPVLAFVDINNYRYLNGPNILKVDEEDLTDIKKKKPSGFQVLEELVYADQVDHSEVKKIAQETRNRLKLILENTTLAKNKDYHFLWMFRNAITRVALTGITGFDSPVLENSLEEAKMVYRQLSEYLDFYQERFEDQQLYVAWKKAIDETMLNLGGDFDTFDRYAFLKAHVHPQLELWNKTVRDWQVVFPFTLAINNEVNTLFANNTFNLEYFADPHISSISEEKIQLGEMLFNDASLSSTQDMSCATCHKKDLAFTDGKKISPGQLRNSPTLTYAGIQNGFFYDARSGSLEGQIISVVNNPTEFHTDLNAMAESVKANRKYVEAFSAIYEDTVSDRNVRNAIATYIRNLAPFNSRFDRSINGGGELVTKSEINGFNLFMGKAKCATCHFAPVFNGTVPPEFTETELELLGVPSKSLTANAEVDPDVGRYTLFNTEERKFFFKTPTIRNISKTAPYMHNGVYETLEEVIDFYDRGGGAGIGIELEYQTLPPDPLNLTEEEKQDLINFMHSLDDDLSVI